MKLLANGNIEITVQLTPDGYAALTAVMDRDGLTQVDAINIALLSLDLFSKAMVKAGTPLRAGTRALHEATE